MKQIFQPSPKSKSKPFIEPLPDMVFVNGISIDPKALVSDEVFPLYLASGEEHMELKTLKTITVRGSRNQL